MTDHDDRWKVIGEAVLAQRTRNQWSRAEFCRRADVSEPVIRAIENGAPGERRRDTLAKIEQALNWPPGAITYMHAGGEPFTWLPPDDRPLMQATERRPFAEVRQRYDALLDELGEIVEHLSYPALEELLSAAHRIAADEGQAQVDSWLEDLMKDGHTYEEAVSIFVRQGDEDHDDELPLAADEARPQGDLGTDEPMTRPPTGDTPIEPEGP